MKVDANDLMEVFDLVTMARDRLDVDDVDEAKEFLDEAVELMKKDPTKV